VVDQQLGQALERKAVHTRTQALLDSPYGPFDFANVTVRRDNIQDKGT
jgi:hypothetical protein